MDDRIRELERMSAERPDDLAVWLQLARACTRADRIAQAEHAYERVRELDPLETEAWERADPPRRDLAQLRPVARPATGNAATLSADIAPDGGRLAVGGTARRVIVFETGRWDDVLELPGHAGSVRAIAFSPDGARIAASADSEVTVWDASARASASGFRPPPIARWGGERGRPSVNALGWTSDGARLIATRDAAGALVLDPAREEPVAELRAPGEERCALLDASVASAPDADLIAIGATDGRVLLFEGTERSDPVAELSGHQGAVYGVAFSRGGDRLVTGSHDGALIVWDVATRARALELLPFARHSQAIPFRQSAGGPGGSRQGVIAALALSPRGRYAAVQTSWGEVVVLDLLVAAGADPVVRSLRGHGGHWWGNLCWSRDGRHLVQAQGGLEVWGLPWVPIGPGVGPQQLLPPGIDTDVPPPPDFGYA